MPTLEVYDTVRVKNDKIIGIVERTHFSNASDGVDISEFLIIAHVQVPQDVILEFATAGGIPPKNYVFVVATDGAEGAFLATEDDLELLSRSFDLGDDVKRQDGLIGTVIDVSDIYQLRPIWLHRGNQIKHVSEFEFDSSDVCISNVPSRELRDAEDVSTDHLVSVDHWLGIVQDTEIDVILRLTDDSVVCLTDPSDLFLPITDLQKPLIHLPEFDLDNFKRPHLLSAFGGFSSVIATDHPRLGALVVTSRSTIRNGRMLSGSFNRDTPFQGRVLAVLPRKLFIHWLLCSPFIPSQPEDLRPPSEEIKVYENIATHTRGSDLRKSARLTVFDDVAAPIEPDVNGFEDSSQHSISLRPDLRAGDCVRFRDPAAAAVKYQDSQMREGCFDRIPPELSGGWDMNVFTVVLKHQNVRVMWYDGSISEVNANNISKFGSFDQELRPTEIVVSRGGLKMAPCKDAIDQSTEPCAFTDFNEMKYFEKPHDLMPQRVGVIQAIDARERVASVRWYEDPQLLLQGSGRFLSLSSFFGPIGQIVEEVSLYEIMSFPALDRDYGNLVIIPSKSLSQTTVDFIRRGGTTSSLRSLFSMLGGGRGAPDHIFHHTRERLRVSNILDTIQPNRIESGNALDNVDWVGEIVGLGLDGSITVRLGGVKPCRDEIMDFDRVLATIDLLTVSGQDTGDQSSQDMDSSYLSGASTISETIEYEGGERLDHDTDDENWESAEEDILQLDEDVEMSDPPELEPERGTLPPSSAGSANHLTTAPTEPASASFQPLLSQPIMTAPPSFDVLDIQPPPDQHQPASIQSPSSSAFLKRIRYEHKILISSLPPSIYVRTYEANLGLLRCLIIGPTDTPYEHAPFVIDLALPVRYPSEPPVAHFHSWTSGLGRINPNLYEEGKICLSLLGTWPGQSSKEQWSKDATILQLLLSLQGLVMVAKPFYNEAGFEEYANEPGYENESAQYSEKAYVMARGFVKHALARPPTGLQDILSWIYFPPVRSEGMFGKVLERGRQLIESSIRARAGNGGGEGVLIDGAGNAGSEAFLRPLSKGAMVMLRRLLGELEACLETSAFEGTEV